MSYSVILLGLLHLTCVTLLGFEHIRFVCFEQISTKSSYVSLNNFDKILKHCEQFLLFKQCFPNYCVENAPKGACILERAK